MVKDIDLNEKFQQEVLQLLLHDLDTYEKSKHLIKKEYFTHLPAQTVYQKLEESHSIHGLFPTKGLLLHALQLSPNQVYKEARAIVDAFVDVIYQPLPAGQAEIAQMHYLEFLKHRRMQELYTTSLTRLRDGKYTEALDVIDRARDDITLTPIDYGKLLDEDLAVRIIRRISIDGKTTPADVIPMPLIEFNRAIIRGGISRKTTAVIVAGTGVGKSILLMNIGATAVMQGKFVIHITLENTLEETQDRYDGFFLKWPLHDLYLKGKATAEVLPLVLEIVKSEGGDMLIKEYLPGEVTVPMIERFVLDTEDRLNRKCDMLIIDYADEMKLQKSVFAETRAIWQEHYTKITGLAKKLDVVLWTATQGNTSSHEQEVLTKASVAEGIAKLRPVPYVLGMSRICTVNDIMFYHFNVLKSRIGKENGVARFKLNERGLVFETCTEYEQSLIKQALEKMQTDNKFSKNRRQGIASNASYTIGTDVEAS